MTASDGAGLAAALESLAIALDRREFAAILVTGAGSRPCLTVANRHTRVAENIYADRSAYWWSWAEPIAATSDPLAAAHRVTSVLGYRSASLLMTETQLQGDGRVAGSVEDPTADRLVSKRRVGRRIRWQG